MKRRGLICAIVGAYAGLCYGCESVVPDEAPQPRAYAPAPEPTVQRDLDGEFREWRRAYWHMCEHHFTAAGPDVLTDATTDASLYDCGYLSSATPCEAGTDCGRRLSLRTYALWEATYAQTGGEQ